MKRTDLVVGQQYGLATTGYGNKPLLVTFLGFVPGDAKRNWRERGKEVIHLRLDEERKDWRGSAAAGTEIYVTTAGELLALDDAMARRERADQKLAELQRSAAVQDKILERMAALDLADRSVLQVAVFDGRVHLTLSEAGFEGFLSLAEAWAQEHA